MSDLEQVTVQAFVPRGNPVTLIEASELRMLRAENSAIPVLIWLHAELAWKFGVHRHHGGNGWGTQDQFIPHWK